MQEADRQRIARDIHDTVVQGLTALIHKNEFVGKIFETDKQDVYKRQGTGYTAACARGDVY